MRTITIYADGTFATSGTLNEHGSIRDADGVFGDEEATEAVYEAIELAADAAKDSVEVYGVKYTWAIEDRPMRSYYAARYPYGANAISATTGQVIVDIYRFPTPGDRDAWVERRDTDLSTNGGYREALTTSEPEVRRALRLERSGDYVIREADEWYP